MDRDTEIRLLDELLGLLKKKSAYLDEAVARSPVSRYADPARFEIERQALFRGRPIPIALSSEMAGEGAFLRRDLAGSPLLLTRDRDGAAHGFLNICRHRGAPLVSDADRGCRRRFTCPYHAWTWDNQGRLIGAPHREQGFPDLDAETYGLKRVALAERFGLLWAQGDLDDAGAMDLEDWLAPLGEDLAWIDPDGLEVHASEETVWEANWKILVEGGLEAYHFRVAHAATIAGLFHDNLSTYQTMGPHIRSILARKSIDSLIERPLEEWRIREHANVLYSLFPAASLLVQADHVAAILVEPIAVDRTRTRLLTLRPKAETPLDEKTQRYWDKNHALTVKTLAEDFDLGQKIQAGIASGANEAFTFGRFEGALERFNAAVDAAIAPLEAAGAPSPLRA